MNTIKILAVAAIALIGCGDNKTVPDARPDATPAAPTLGAQIDRMGRPAVNTVMNHGFDPTAAAGPAKDSYNADSSKMSWLTSNGMQFALTLALADALDTGVCGNALCESTENSTNCALDCSSATNGTGNGCGNSAMYTPDANGNPMQTSYATLAGVLANDQLILDTSKSQCNLYLAVEFILATNMPPGSNSSCGGRAPQYDVIDFSYSMLTMGDKGFNLTAGFMPKLGDGVGPHTDYSTTFPFLGAPH